MLTRIKSIEDSLVKFLKDDPVRPHIPHAQRIGNGRDVFVLLQDSEPAAIVCASYQQSIPVDEQGLFESTTDPDAVVFYTIWSYAPGSAARLIFSAVDQIRAERPDIKKFVTLSPKTEMARKFHLKNGAVVYRENAESVNYRYLLS